MLITVMFMNWSKEKWYKKEQLREYCHIILEVVGI